MKSMINYRGLNVWLCVVVIVLFLFLLLTRTRQGSTPLHHYLLPQRRQPHPSHTCNSTIISAYYRIKSKHSYDEYLSWMTNFLSMPDCMVIFVQPGLESLIMSLRPPSHQTLVIPRPLETFLSAQLLDMKGWQEQEQKDPEHYPGHSKELFWIWNEKTNLMKIVSDINPFFSSYFVWLDIGAVRHTWYNYQLMIRNIPKEKGVLLLSVENFTKEELMLENNKSDFSLVNRIGGTTIGCDKDSVGRWHEAYYRTVREYLQMGRFIGKDQSMMATTCLETDMCLLVKEDKHWWSMLEDNNWFLMQEWFRGEKKIKPVRLKRNS